MSVKIIGTGHILQKSVIEVKSTIEADRPQVVAVELDYGRFKALEEMNFTPEAYRRPLSFVGVLSETLRGGSFPVFIQGVLALVQQDLGEKYGIRPGSDMCAAILSARDLGSEILLIDRDLSVTLNHMLQIPIREVFALSAAYPDIRQADSGVAIASMDDILEKENISKILEGFKKKQPALYSALVDERDRYMAYMLWRAQRDKPEKNIVAVVGAGHASGVARYLEELDAGHNADIAPLLAQKQVSFPKMVMLILALCSAFILLRIKSLSLPRIKGR